MAGRPTKFKEEYIHQARVAFGEGFTDVKFCKMLNIGRRTFNDWRQAHEEFSKAVQEGKDEFDTDRVEASLKKRANGYSFTETTREIEKIEIDEETGKEKPTYRITKKVSKHVSPDTTAAIFWLKNRRRERWKDIKATEISGADGGPVPIRYVDVDEASA